MSCRSRPPGRGDRGRTRRTCPGARPGRIGHIGNAFVLASFADRGVPAALLTAVVEHARERRYRSLLLAPTAGSTAFYRRAGFNPAGESLLALDPAT